MIFTLAQLSDVHLGPLPRGAIWRDFSPKRIIGGASWLFNRQHMHVPEIAAALRADIMAARPDHIALTGDLVNIAAPAEFPRAAQWLQDFAPPTDLSFIPGNHDTYVPVYWERGLKVLEPWMKGDMTVANAVISPLLATPFPYVRLRRNVALIGLSTAVPQSLRKAGGSLGPGQIAAAAQLLRQLRERGYYRAVMIHHPPLPGQNSPRKALTDAEAFTEVLIAEGAELVLHGHNHRAMNTPLAGRHGPVPVIGVPSASMVEGGVRDPAAWNRYTIERRDGRWHTEVSVRRWHAASASLVDADSFQL